MSRDNKLVETSKAAERLKLIWDDYQLRLAFLALVVYFILRVPWLREALKSLNVDPAVLDFTVLVPIILTMVLWQTVQITRRLVEVQGDSVPGQSLSEVQAALPKAVERASGRERTLDVAGVSLRDSWSDIRQMLDDERFRGWTVNIAAFTGPAEANSPQARWAQHAQQYLEEATLYSRKTKLREQGTVLNVYHHSHLPIVHGFRVGTGEFFVATLHWREDGRNLSASRHKYDHVRSDDFSASAKHKRQLFATWIKASQQQTYIP